MTHPPRTVLVLPPMRPDAVAKICGLLGTGGHLLTQTGSLLLVLDAGREAGEVTPRVSRSLRRAEVLQLQLVDGYLTAERWRRGQLVDKPAAGLLAQSLPEPTIGLVHGSLDPGTWAGARAIVPVSGSWLQRIRGH